MRQMSNIAAMWVVFNRSIPSLRCTRSLPASGLVSVSECMNLIRLVMPDWVATGRKKSPLSPPPSFGSTSLSKSSTGISAIT